MKYSETPARRAPALWVELDGKRALCALPARSLRRLRAAASARQWGRHASGKWALRCRQRAGQAAHPPRIKGNLYTPPLHIGEAQRNDFSPKRNCSGGSLGMAYLPTAPRQGCAPKDERRMLAYLLLSAPFAPTKATYIKQKGCTGGGGLCGGLLREKSSEGLTRGVLALLGHDRKWSDREVWASSCWSQQDRTSAYPVSSSCCSFPKGATEEFFSSETFSSYQWATLYCCCNT